jgi:hypothetical protein
MDSQSSQPQEPNSGVPVPPPINSLPSTPPVEPEPLNPPSPTPEEPAVSAPVSPIPDVLPLPTPAPSVAPLDSVPPTKPIEPVQTITPIQVVQPQAQNLNSSPAPPAPSGENASIANPKYWLTIVGFLVVEGALLLVDRKIAIIKLIPWIIWVSALVGMYIAITKLKSAGTDSLTKSDKYKMVLFMAIDPVIGQAAYYYSFKKSLPQNAKISLKIGWKVFLIELIPTFIIILVLAIVLAIPALQRNSWLNQNNTNFKSDVTKIDKDITDAGNAVTSQNTDSLQADCQNLIKDTKTTESLSAYPVKLTQAKLTAALQILNLGGTNCVSAVTQYNTTLLNLAGEQFENGIGQLNTVTKQIEVTSP